MFLSDIALVLCDQLERIQVKSDADNYVAIRVGAKKEDPKYEVVTGPKGEKYIKVPKDEYQDTNDWAQIGNICWAIFDASTRFKGRRKLSDFVKPPPWQKAIDRIRWDEAREHAKALGLSMPDKEAESKKGQAEGVPG